MKRIDVGLDDRSYPIWIGSGILGQFSDLFHSYRDRQWAIITQQSIQNLFGEKLIESLNSAGFNVIVVVIPEEEKAKSLSQVESIYHSLLEKNCDRSTILMALGGGVVGDITGFVAATYMRGIDYVQVPTTLLAMVDSAIGGKTGVNLPQGKNLIGAFHQPRSVVVDIELLQNLPDREVISAMGEMLKYGAIQDREFFMRLKENMNSLLSFENETLLIDTIGRCCEIKADVVSRDERESDLRRILNFGHTIGHALETTVGFGILKHGEAVAYGMIAASYISHDMGYLNRKERDLLESTIRNLPLPELMQIDTTTLLETIKHDKKVRAGKVHFVVLKGLGNAIVTNQISDDSLVRAMELL